MMIATVEHRMQAIHFSKLNTLMEMCKYVNMLCSCCNDALNYRAITYSGTIDLNKKAEETIVPMHNHRGGGQQPHIPDGERDLGPNNDMYTPFSGY